MKKTMFLTLALIACVFSFVSCEKESDSDDSASIVGTWSLQNVEGTASAMGITVPISKEDIGLGETITFNADGTTSDKGTTYKVANGKLTLSSNIGLSYTFNIETLNASTLKLGMNQSLVEEGIEVVIDAIITFSRVK